jgi:hypothetical protein
LLGSRGIQRLRAALRDPIHRSVCRRPVLHHPCRKFSSYCHVPTTLYQSIEISNSDGDAGEKEEPNRAPRRRRRDILSSLRNSSRSCIQVASPRINWNRLFFKISADSQFPFSDDELRRFDSLPTSRKFIFTTRSLPDVKCAITTPDYLKDGKLMYERTHRYVDMAAWLNSTEP